MRSTSNGDLNTPPLKSTAVGCRKLALSVACVWQSFEFGERRHLTAEERREMTRDRRVLRIRQAQLRQTGARAAHRTRGAIHLREEAVEDRLREFGARQFGADRAADQLRAAARHDERHGRLPCGSLSSVSLAARHA